MSKAIEERRRRVLGGRKDGQNRHEPTSRIEESPAADCLLGILPQDLEISDPTSVELKSWIQAPGSIAAGARLLCRALRHNTSTAARGSMGFAWHAPPHQMVVRDTATELPKILK
jgi:hypothetical protein